MSNHHPSAAVIAQDRRARMIAEAMALELQARRIRDAQTPEAERDAVFLAHVHLENIRAALVAIPAPEGVK